MGSGHAVGPILQTGAQNDQIRTTQLKITNQRAAAQYGGYARVPGGTGCAVRSMRTALIELPSMGTARLGVRGGSARWSCAG